jgi:hypothetical protein
MNISKLLSICALCCIGMQNCNAMIPPAIHHNMANNIIPINDANLELTRAQTYVLNRVAVNNNMFKNRATIYSNSSYLNAEKNYIDIAINKRNNAFYSNEAMETFNNLQVEKFNALKQSLGKDLITYTEEDVKEIFGSDYKIYFDYSNMDYEGQQIDENGYKEYFEGTFEDLMEKNNSHLISQIQYDLQFMKNIWFLPYSITKYLVITDNNIVYYFDIDNNKILIYSKKGHQKSWKESENAIVHFISKFNKRWNEEQTAVHNIFGNDYGIYYDYANYVNDPNSDYLEKIEAEFANE